MTEFLFNSLTTVLMGLFVGNQLGFCYVLWFLKRDQLSESQRRYVAATAAVGLVVLFWFFVSGVVSIVRLLTLT